MNPGPHINFVYGCAEELDQHLIRKALTQIRLVFGTNSATVLMEDWS
jgi:hypothetical protein